MSLLSDQEIEKLVDEMEERPVVPQFVAWLRLHYPPKVPDFGTRSFLVVL
jgi:hypothetical protein